MLVAILLFCVNIVGLIFLFMYTLPLDVLSWPF